MKPAAVSHVLMKMEHRFTSFIELLFVCRNDRRQSMRCSSFSEFADNPQLPVPSELLHVAHKHVQKLLELISDCVFTVQQVLPACVRLL